MKQAKTLFDKTRIGSLELKNRFIRAAVADKTQDGRVDETMIENYLALARGGVGTIVTGYTLASPDEKRLPIVALYGDEFIGGHEILTTTIREYDVNLVLQLVYVGSYTPAGWESGGPVAVAPSSVANRITNTPAREMRLTEIKAVQIEFADAALRAKKAGYDGVEIHAAHGFLLSQFLTPYYNRRTDSYGGPIKNRARMLLETFETVRDTVGDDFGVWVKINTTDNMDEGISPDDCRYVCRELAALGVDAIETSGNWVSMATRNFVYFKDAAEIIAEENDVPVILTGGNRDFSEMTDILNTTKIGYFGIARPFMKNPNLVNDFARDCL